MKKIVKLFCCALLCFATMGLMTSAADVSGPASTLDPVKKEKRFLTEKQRAERDSLFRELEFWELSELAGGELVPSEGGGYERASMIDDPAWNEKCAKQIERLYQELYERFGVRRLTQEEAEEEFCFGQP